MGKKSYPGLGEFTARLISKAFKGRVGPMGGEDPHLFVDEVTLSSQLADDTFRFNDDGSVDFVNWKEAFYRAARELGLEKDDGDYEDLRDFYIASRHFDSTKSLLESDSGWFMYMEHPKAILDKVEAYKGLMDE